MLQFAAAVESACNAIRITDFKTIKARPVVLRLKRPVVARIATITDWPIVLTTPIPRKASSVAAIPNRTP